MQTIDPTRKSKQSGVELSAGSRNHERKPVAPSLCLSNTPTGVRADATDPAFRSVEMLPAKRRAHRQDKTMPSAADARQAVYGVCASEEQTLRDKKSKSLVA